jgi:membrane protein
MQIATLSSSAGRRRLQWWWNAVRDFSVVMYNELWRTRIFTNAAAMAFFFMMALIPLLLIFSSLLQYLPIPNLFDQLLDLMAELVPPDAMSFVQTMLTSILKPGRAKLLSFGILGYLWSASGGFSSLIESLNVAYDVQVSRSWLSDRLRAMILTFTSGGLVVLSLLALIAGPRVGHFASMLFPIPAQLQHFWPVLRVSITVITFVAALEIVYFLGPNVRHSFLSTLPGASFAIGIWFLGSAGLSFYLGHLSNYNVTYGSMGAIIGLMLWCYLTAIAILIGAEMNSELCKRRGL